MSGLEPGNGTNDDWRSAVRRAERDLENAGLALFRWFSVEEANRHLSTPHRLPDAGTTGLIIGNTLSLWPPFLRSKESFRRSAHPLDRYVEDSVRAAIAPLSPRWLRFAHQLFPSPIPIQRYAAVSGLSQMSPVGLSVHAHYGPWIALRAVAIFASPHASLPQERSEHPCDTCARPCVAPFERAMKDPSRSARSFLPVRMACPVGVEHRYSAEQIDYHYGAETNLSP